MAHTELVVPQLTLRGASILRRAKQRARRAGGIGFSRDPCAFSDDELAAIAAVDVAPQ
jgi:hypothetical protein